MELIIAFTDDSGSFTNGVEFGRLLAKMECGLPVVENSDFPVHSDNEEVLRRAAKQYGYVPAFGPCIDNKGNTYPGWVNFCATKKPCLN